MKYVSINLRQTNAYRARVLEKVFFAPYSFAVYCFLLLPLSVLALTAQTLVPLIEGFTILGYGLWMVHRFRRHLRKNRVSEKEQGNLAHELSYHMIEHLMEKREISPTTIVQSALQSARGQFVLQQIGVEGKDLLSAWESGEVPTLEELFQWIAEAKAELHTSTLDSTATIFAIVTHVASLTKLINVADISANDIRTILASEAFHFEEMERRRHPFSPASIVQRFGSIGTSWITGYNTELERLTENLSAHCLGHTVSVRIHEKEMKTLTESIVGGSPKNFLLVGPPGCGKRTLIRNVTAALKEHDLARGLGSTEVLRLKTTTLLSGSDAGDRELLSALEKVAFGGQYVVVIDDVAILLQGSDARLKNILISLLQAKNVRTIAIATPKSYHESVKPNPSIDTLFDVMMIEQPSNEDVMHILFEEYFLLEKKKHIRIPQKTLKNILELSHRYLANSAMPGKAVEVLREAVAAVNARNEHIITEECIRDIVSTTSNIDVRRLTTDDRQKLLVLDDRMKRHMIGQEKAISAIVHALKRAKVDLGTRKKPMGTFLFLGSTGIGKTETAKALATEYFGSEDCMIRIDMNDLSTEDGVRSLIGGSGPSGFTEGNLTSRVHDRPYALILLDEIEKAHPKVLAVLLQMLDEGMLTDGAGVRTDFRNTIIIATSNAGSRMLATSQGAEGLAEAEFKKALLLHIIEERTFSPEFVNRFDDVIVFETPTATDIERMTILMLDELIRSTNEKHGIRISIEQGVVEELAKRGFSPTFGAREMRRTITRTIEDYIADTMLTHTVQRGDEILIRLQDLHV